MRTIVILLLCSGCTWGVGEYIGYDACQRENLARDSHARVEEMKAIIPAPVLEEVAPYLDRIQTNCSDQVQRAQIIQSGNKYPPKEVPPLRSPADDKRVQEGAGLNRAVATMRKVGTDLPKVIGRGAVAFVRDIIPWWVWTALFVLLGGIGFSFRAAAKIRSALDGMIKTGNKKGAKEVFRGQTNGYAQKRYRILRDKGLLERGDEQGEASE
jgi:hypothetical protein